MADKFCTKCGKVLEDGMQFCPNCGVIVPGTDADIADKAEKAEFARIVKEGNSVWLTFVLAIYAIPAVLFGIFGLIQAGPTAVAIMNDAAIVTWFAEQGIILTLDMVRGWIMAAAGLELASGIFVAISLFCVYKRKNWLVAFVCCFIGALLCCWSVFGMFIGILVAIMIWNSKDMFEDTKKDAADDAEA